MTTPNKYIPSEWLEFKNAFEEAAKVMTEGQRNARMMRKALEKKIYQFKNELRIEPIESDFSKSLPKHLESRLRELLVFLRKSQQTILNKIQETAKEFTNYEENEDRFVLLVFGIVNSGKTALANHVAGLDYEIDPTLKAECFVEDRTVKRLEEAPIECTNLYQGFRLPGLLWIDCPGVLSSTKANAEKALRYVTRADFLIFVTASDAPFKTSEMEELKRLIEESGQKKIDACLVVTKADQCVLDEDPDTGLEVRRLLPKESADLKRQIEWYKDQLNIKGLRERLRFTEPLITSTYIARDALGRRWDTGGFFREPEKDWRTRYQLSGMADLFKLLANLARTEGPRLKAEWPKKRARGLATILQGILNESQNKLAEAFSELESYRAKWQSRLNDTLSTACELAEGGVADCLKKSGVDNLNSFDKEKARSELLKLLKESVLNALNPVSHELVMNISTWIDSVFAMYADKSKFTLDLRNVYKKQTYKSTKKSEAVGGAIGGAAGGVGGAELGAAIGSALLPGLGTLIGGLLGALFGGKAGSSLGKAIGEEVYQEDVEIEALAGTNAEEVIRDTRKEIKNLVTTVIENLFKKVDEDVFVRLGNELKALQSELNEWGKAISELMAFWQGLTKGI